MEIILESQITFDQLNEINTVQRLKNCSKNLDDLYEKLKMVKDLLHNIKFGRGGNHIWISGLDNKRILLINRLRIK